MLYGFFEIVVLVCQFIVMFRLMVVVVELFFSFGVVLQCVVCWLLKVLVVFDVVLGLFVVCFYVCSLGEFFVEVLRIVIEFGIEFLLIDVDVDFEELICDLVLDMYFFWSFGLDWYFQLFYEVFDGGEFVEVML